jgi:hypothetical protein
MLTFNRLNQVPLTTECYLDGQWICGPSKAMLPIRNLATGEVVAIPTVGEPILKELAESSRETL